MSWRALTLMMSIAAAWSATSGCHGRESRGTIPAHPIRDEQDPESDFLYYEGAVPAGSEAEADGAEVEGETTIEIDVDEEAAGDAKATTDKSADTDTSGDDADEPPDSGDDDDGDEEGD